MSSDIEYVRSEVTFKNKTDDAVLVLFVDRDDDDVKRWVPRSQLHYSCDIKINELKKNEEFELVVTEWLANKIGLQY